MARNRERRAASVAVGKAWNEKKALSHSELRKRATQWWWEPARWSELLPKRQQAKWGPARLCPLPPQCSISSMRHQTKKGKRHSVATPGLLARGVLSPCFCSKWGRNVHIVQGINCGWSRTSRFTCLGVPPIGHWWIVALGRLSNSMHGTSLAHGRKASVFAT